MAPISDTMFSLLDQGGPFATPTLVPPVSIFSPASRRMAGKVRQTAQHTKYRVIRNQIFDLLQIDSFADLHKMAGNNQLRQEVSRTAYRMLGNMFGINTSFAEIVTAINNHSRTADGVIRYLKGKVLANFASHIEMTNEIDVIANPVDLLLIIFDKRYHQKARFEARRKLLLMNLAGTIAQRERETEIEAKFAGFLDFLNRYVWDRDSTIGELEPVYVFSEHDPADFSCKTTKILSLEEGAACAPGPNRKLTLLKRRRFYAGDRNIPIYVSIRKKPPEAKVLKLLRKGEENPAVAVDDELGLMAVLDTIADVNAFLNHLTRSAKAADSFMVLEDIEDSLSVNQSRAKNIGSSRENRMLKFFARLGGMRVEFIVHTTKSYLNYVYQRDVAHDEYEVKRIFDSGVAGLLFPEDIYYLDLKKAREYQLAWFRKQLEYY